MSMFNPDLLASKVVPFEKFKPFLTVSGGHASFPDKNSEQGKSLIAEGEKALKYIPGILPLSKYRMFTDNGDRKEYESLYFERRNMLLNLIAAELCEKEGRFIKKIMDLLFAICEESTWVIPAHNYSVSNHYNTVIAKMPEPVGENVWAIDLFSAATGALVALAYYFFRDTFEKEIPRLFNERIIYELNKKIIKPYLSTIELWWMGYISPNVNNWNPWINSSIMTVAAYAVHDLETRKALVRKCAESINFYTNSLPSDGGCDEGPNYWGAAGACVVEFAELCYDITGGKYSVFKNKQLIDVVKYVTKVNIAGNYYFNCADAHPESVQNYSMIRRFGKLSGDQTVYSFGNEMLKHEKIHKLGNSHQPDPGIRALLDLAPDLSVSYTAEKTAYLPALQIAAVRSCNDAGKGFYLGIKGGHNAENHNHFDVGNFIVYHDGKPVIIDPGVGTYTKFTFMAETRYKMFAFRTEDHNLPTINGEGQWTEREHHADNFSFDEKNGTVSVELKNAYKNKKEIESYLRTVSLKNDKIDVFDEIKLKKSGSAVFRYWLIDKPEKISDNEIRLSGKITMKISEGFNVSIDEIAIEDISFKNDWNRDYFYRITINPAKAGKNIALHTEIK